MGYAYDESGNWEIYATTWPEAVDDGRFHAAAAPNDAGAETESKFLYWTDRQADEMPVSAEGFFTETPVPLFQTLQHRSTLLPFFRISQNDSLQVAGAFLLISFDRHLQ